MAVDISVLFVYFLMGLVAFMVPILMVFFIIETFGSFFRRDKHL